MDCPYPDCNGQVLPGQQFCGECGRSLAPEAVAAALQTQTPGSAGATSAFTTGETPTVILPPGSMAAFGPPGPDSPPAVPPSYGPAPLPPVPPTYSATPLPPVSPPYGPAPLPGSQAAIGPTMAPGSQPTYGPPVPPMQGGMAGPPGVMPASVAPPVRRGFNPLWLLLGGLGAVILGCIACVALFVILPSSSSTPTPTLFEDFPTATTAALTAPTATTAALTAPTATTGSRSLVPQTATPGSGVVPPAGATDTPFADETPTDTGQVFNTHTEFDNYTTSSGTLVVFGTVHNISGTPLEDIKVTAELRDANDATVGTGDDTFLTLAVLQPDQVVPFQVLITTTNGNGDKIHVTVESTPYDSSSSTVFAPAPSLTVEGTSLGGDPGSQQVLGRIKNGGKADVTLAKALVIGYAADGTVADVAEGFSKLDPLPAGEDSTFSAQFTREDTTIVKYDVVAFGSVQP